MKIINVSPLEGELCSQSRTGSREQGARGLVDGAGQRRPIQDVGQSTCDFLELDISGLMKPCHAYSCVLGLSPFG